MSEYEMTQKGGRERAVHILLVEQLLGRPLEENEVVHHINGDKKDNRLENLRVMRRKSRSKEGELAKGKQLARCWNE